MFFACVPTWLYGGSKSRLPRRCRKFVRFFGGGKLWKYLYFLATTSFARERDNKSCNHICACPKSARIHSLAIYSSE